MRRDPKHAPYWAQAGLAIAVGLLPSLAAAEPEFRVRAAGHVFKCGDRIVEVSKEGSATLSVAGNPTILTSTKAKWSPHRVKLSFGAGTAPVKLSEFGATVSLKSSAGTTVCIGVR